VTGGRGGPATGPDGSDRCPWALSAPEYLAYHDLEWGRPVRGERQLFERITLEAFQSGLSWLTILRKREGFRQAFEGFDPEKVARFGPDRVEGLLADPGIVRNRAKIQATVRNAAVVLDLRGAVPGGLEGLFRSFAPRDHLAPSRQSEIPSSTDGSMALARELKRHGMRFLGPTTVYAAMQACGFVNDHLTSCFVRGSAISHVRSTEP